MYLRNDTLLQGGKYKIVRFISSGGFGCTYEAEHVMLQTQMAIKEFFIKAFCNRDETTAHITVGTQSNKGLVDKLRGKFIDEAKAISHMRHPNIVRVSDVFEENGTAYYVMDYIDGQSLGEILNKEGTLSEQRALKYIRQIAEALQHVHKQNRLHLDVKPSNIMIDNADNAILIDFGASKQYDEDNGQNTTTLMGKTPGYAPLEQMGNNVVTFQPATDIYALGATLYKMLMGVTPPEANLLANGDKELGALPAEIGKNTSTAILSAMKIRRKDRPQSIEAFLSILNGNIMEEEVTVIDIGRKEPATPKERREPQTTTQKASSSKKNKEEAKKRNRLMSKMGLVCLVAFCVIAIVGVVGIWMINQGGTTTPTEKNTKVEKTEKKQKKVENQQMTYNGERYTYTGSVNDEGHANGQGVGIYKNGTYTGRYVNGCREGQATYVTFDGENTFEGTYKDDKYAQGKMTFKDGSYFEGSFKDNKFDTGKFYNKDGSFDSEMKDGKYI